MKKVIFTRILEVKKDITKKFVRKWIATFAAVFVRESVINVTVSPLVYTLIF